ncbi:MAG: hypothetical protein II640_01490, partial [Lachnospiraceae bacterium]|nr:hypothetical protein [Lachnospiraceae bacterium]
RGRFFLLIKFFPIFTASKQTNTMKKFFTSLLALLGLAACGQQGSENADVNGWGCTVRRAVSSAS